jgi:predicted ATPase
MPSHALDHITIQGFKSIASIEKLELRPINVLIGPNGSGKSNFLGAFELVRSSIAPALLEAYVTRAGGAEKILHFGSKTTREVRITFDGKVGQWEYQFLPSGDTLKRPGVGLRELARSGWHHVYHLDDTSPSSPLRHTHKVHDNRTLRPDGSNVAALLYLLREKHTATYGLIEQTVQRVAPFFGGFELGPLKLAPDDIKLEWRHKNSDQYFDAWSLSDGTLRFIALATLFLQPVELRPSVILVDEPELGLHPYAIGLLASLIRQASVDTQVIVSTQSSLLLDYFEPEDVLVAERANGATTLKRLDSGPLAKWLEDYSLGQLWEKNELGGRP